MSTDMVLSPFDNALVPEGEALQQIADFLSLNVAEGDAADSLAHQPLGAAGKPRQCAQHH